MSHRRSPPEQTVRSDNQVRHPLEPRRLHRACVQVQIHRLRSRCERVSPRRGSLLIRAQRAPAQLDQYRAGGQRRAPKHRHGQHSCGHQDLLSQLLRRAVHSLMSFI